jgi:uncharacterized cupin superfamily protein
MPKIDIASLSEVKGTGYPAPFDQPCLERTRKRLGEAGGLSQFGVNLLMLKPGVWSSQRHWHSDEDEFVYVLEGEVALIDDSGETVLRPGDCVAFPKGQANGHHLVNKSGAPALCLEVGSRSPDDVCLYPDIDLRISGREKGFTHRNGTPYARK